MIDDFFEFYDDIAEDRTKLDQFEFEIVQAERSLRRQGIVQRKAMEEAKAAQDLHPKERDEQKEQEKVQSMRAAEWQAQRVIIRERYLTALRAKTNVGSKKGKTNQILHQRM